MIPSDAEALIIFLLYCLAAHLIHQELERHGSSDCSLRARSGRSK
jgi:hypothetical protein